MLGQDIVQKIRGNVRLYFAGWKERLNLGPRTMHTHGLDFVYGRDKKKGGY